jgi:hypothetical protein
MTVDTDTPMIPTRFHNLIVWRALAEYGGFDAASEVFTRADRNYAMGMSACCRLSCPCASSQRGRWHERQHAATQDAVLPTGGWY